MGRDMADSFHVSVGDVPPVPGLGPDHGWVGMTVQFLVDSVAAGAEHVVFGRAVFAPGESEHQWHRHPGAEEFVHDRPRPGDGAGRRQRDPGDAPATSPSTRRAPGTASGTPPTTEEAEMIWGWAGAASRSQAGYELRYPPK